MRRLLVAVVVAVAGAGCVSLPQNGALKCASDTAHECPSGFHCASDGYCWRSGSEPDGGGPDLSSTVILTPPAAVWVSSGGGSVSAPSGTRLNTCIGGAVAPGSQTAASGATITRGYFTSDTH